ncbi:hypothetical protein MTDSW087_04224 [Methylobacterium dankookense]|uniref:Uncharacterized protein n=1 Tax=Methylobacterium dankookense TaxID=560405 RepID=A0A564G1Y9_9HYPH|nr:hypothetical protein AU375_03380 [Methylobacterium radiotolerans]GJD54906.1 hypothetical protein IFDJLNFL_0785 [Methylobacterium dankookense]VUF14499.1 hypothetical protein MTDSW087_04224 [Methylobacterium dankookense]
MGPTCNQTPPAPGLTPKGNSRMTSTGMRSMAETELPLFGVARFRKAR